MAAVGPVAIIPVRAGRLAPGGAEIASLVGADRHGRTLLVGDGTTEASAELAGIVAKVQTAEVEGFAVGALAAALAPVVGAAPYVVLPSSPGGRDLAPRLAAELGRPFHAGALEIDAHAVVVAHQGGLVQATFRPGGPFVATLQPGVRAVEPRAVELHGVGTGTPTATTLDLGLDAPSAPRHRDARVVDVLPPDAATMDLAEAPRIVGAGAGLMAGEPDDVRARLEALVGVGAAIGASMGATRVVTDAGWVGHARQIGTTGVVVDPRLYLAFAISGAVQHTAGLGHPDHIISVNIDPHCPMMAMADLAVVADANATLAALADRLVGRQEEVSHG